MQKQVTFTFYFFVSQREVLFGEQESVSLYNVLFRRVMAALKMCQMNRNFYQPELAMSVPQHR